MRFAAPIVLALLILATPLNAEGPEKPLTAFFRVVTETEEGSQVASGSGFSCERGILTAHHVVERMGDEYIHIDKGTVTKGTLACFAVDSRGRRYRVKSYEQHGKADVVTLTLTRVFVGPRLRLAPSPPPPRHPVQAVGYFSRGFVHGQPSRSHGWLEVISVASQRGSYHGDAFQFSAPVNYGMSGGALLDSRGRVFGVLAHFGRASDSPYPFSGAWAIR